MTFAVLAESVGPAPDPDFEHTGWREFELAVPAHGGWVLDAGPGRRLACLPDFASALAICERLIAAAANDGADLRCGIATGTLSGAEPGARPDFTVRTRKTVQALVEAITAGRLAITVKLHASLQLGMPQAAERFEPVRFGAGGVIASAFLLRRVPREEAPAPPIAPADVGITLPFADDDEADDPIDDRLVDRAERILAESIGSFASWIVEEAAGDAGSNEEFIELVVRASPPSVRARMRTSLTSAAIRHRTIRA